MIEIISLFIVCSFLMVSKVIQFVYWAASHLTGWRACSTADIFIVNNFRNVPVQSQKRNACKDFKVIAH